MHILFNFDFSIPGSEKKRTSYVHVKCADSVSLQVVDKKDESTYVSKSFDIVYCIKYRITNALWL